MDESSGQAAASGPGPDAGSDWESWAAWLDREEAAGRNPVPAEWELEGPAVSLSLGDAADVDPALLAAVCGPDGLGGQCLGPQFGQGGAADVLRPTPVLAALAEQTAADLPRLNDDQLIGVLRAARRLENRAYYLQAIAIAEFAGRREAELEADRARGVPAGCRAGEFPGVELAAELLVSRTEAGRRIDAARDLASRLPKTLAGLADGLVDARRAEIIAAYTGRLGDADAALADEILAGAAPRVRADSLASKAAALEMRLDPQAAQVRREHAKSTYGRVEARREQSGNASVSGREMDVTAAMASKAHIHSVALALRRAGMPGTLDQLRLAVFTELTQGRDPVNLLSPVAHGGTDGAAGPAAPAGPPAGPAAGTPGGGSGDAGGGSPGGPGQPGNHGPGGPREDGRPGAGGPAGRSCPGPGPDDFDCHDCEDPDENSTGDGPGPPGGPAPVPVPALVNLLIPVGTLLGWDTTPGQADGWGLLDPGDTRAIVAAASQHPRTRWCYTLTGRDGTAIAHACAPGRHPWPPPEPAATPPGAPPGAPPHPGAFPGRPPGTGGPPGSRGATGPPPRPPGPGPVPRTDGSPAHAQAARLAELLRALNATARPVAVGTCDHASAEDRYTPSRTLRHLVNARTATCAGPGCPAQAVHADADHTAPWPDGPTCQCNLGPRCRTHHRAKQAPGWKLEQPEPGVFVTTVPSGRAYITGPTVYDYIG